MSFTVYGLRLRGDPEVRYVGSTRHGADRRLNQHFYLTAGMQSGTPFATWLRENRKTIECFTIWEADTGDEALSLERGTIEMCLRLGQRLFNRKHVPAELLAQQDAAA